MVDAKQAYTIWRGSHRELGALAAWEELGDLWQSAFTFACAHATAVERQACAAIGIGRNRPP